MVAQHGEVVVIGRGRSQSRCEEEGVEGSVLGHRRAGMIAHRRCRIGRRRVRGVCIRDCQFNGLWIT